MAIVRGQRPFGDFDIVNSQARMKKVPVYRGSTAKPSKAPPPEPFAASISPSRLILSPSRLGKRSINDTKDGRISLQPIDVDRPAKKLRSMASTWTAINHKAPAEDDEEDSMDNIQPSIEETEETPVTPQRKLAIPKSRKPALANITQSSQTSNSANPSQPRNQLKYKETSKGYKHTEKRKKWKVALPGWNGGPKGENSWMAKKDRPKLKAELQKRGLSHLFPEEEPAKKRMVRAIIDWDNHKAANGLKAVIRSRGRGLANRIDPSWGTDKVHELIALLDQDDKHLDENNKWRLPTEGPDNPSKEDLASRAARDKWAEFIPVEDPCRAFFLPGWHHRSVEYARTGLECGHCKSLKAFLKRYNLMAVFLDKGTLRAEGVWEEDAERDRDTDSEDGDDEAEDEGQSKDAEEKFEEEEL
ncbi:uncharacterized protein BDZ99DRAFT_526369 [Mytilinidion resinicola]|uniref:Uncharacterized protein n=1 Tax=Mytilinidion resinicola TaxID=574789 RepID=A0A6A6Y534_9PEZI|nr:uncharacterized protein BDZ99DRAFT_526369 [Mytilinidion resinicola]KAF2803902.1 hypothetical protein BDZ99DRAFT_526369 [Mytilinidion resinicola]